MTPLDYQRSIDAGYYFHQLLPCQPHSKNSQRREQRIIENGNDIRLRYSQCGKPDYLSITILSLIWICGYRI